MRITSQELMQWSQSDLRQVSNPLVFTGVSIDSRTVKPGDLFVALTGEHFDGHDFIADACRQGALAALVNKTVSAELPLFYVTESLSALQAIATSYRQQFSLPMIGITGSVGKTTTKDLVALLLKPCYEVLKTEGNYNNELGVPLTLLCLNDEYTAAVVEMGMRAPGEIASLAAMVKPGYGIITNIEPVHLETMGSLSAIAQAKCELLSALPSEGFALIYGDQPLLLQTARASGGNIFTFGSNPGNDIILESLQTDYRGLYIKASLFGESLVSFFPIPSPRLAMNVIAAAGMAHKMGVEITEIQALLANFQGGKGRLDIKPLQNGGLIINDTYNANPVSMQAALEALIAVAEARRKVAVLGDMFELGDYAPEGHRLVGERAAQLGVDELVVIGSMAGYIGEGAIENGLPAKNVHIFAKPNQAVSWLIKSISLQDAVLFKASRGMKLEKILDAWINGGVGQ